MRFTVTRLCGGKALMAASKDVLDLDMEKAEKVMAERGPVKSRDDMMLVSQWNEMEVTVYPQGKVMFFPLADKDKAVEYATDIIERIDADD
jgi:ArsR family metal-binding transcriptional regulator